MNPLHAHKTAFSTSHRHYTFTRMPFGLKKHSRDVPTFDGLTPFLGCKLSFGSNSLLCGHSCICQFITRTWCKNSKMMNCLRDANLLFQLDKCEFLRREVAHLDYIIGNNGVRPNPEKITAIKNFPVRRKVKNIKQFLVAVIFSGFGRTPLFPII